MVLPFKERFIPLIKNGRKKHTLREDKHNLWQKGNIMHMATGVRSKKYNEFQREKCKSVQSIVITKLDLKNFSVRVDGRELGAFDVKCLAINDGFDSVEDFHAWFDKDFKGKILHWTDLKY